MDVVIYTTRFCSYCVRAKQLLQSKGLDYTEIPVDQNPMLRREMMEKAGRHTVPQIWVDEHHVGGFTDLYHLDQSGELDKLLTRPK